MYVFDGRAIEVAYQAKGFRHLTGVDTGLDAMSFYKKAVSGTLQANQIFFSPHHPYQLCQRKLVHLSDIAGMVTSECFMLENITTETQSFQFGTTDLAFVLCLNRHKDASGEYKSSKYIVESLRDEDGFAKSEGAYPVTHILSKRNDEPFYHEGRLSGRERKHRDSSAAGRRAGTFDGRSRNVRKDRRPAVFSFARFYAPSKLSPSSGRSAEVSASEAGVSGTAARGTPL